MMCGSLTLFFTNSDMILKPEATKLHPLLERRSIRVSFVGVTSSRKCMFTLFDFHFTQKQKKRKWLNFPHFCLKTKSFVSIDYSYIME